MILTSITMMSRLKKRSTMESLILKANVTSTLEDQLTALSRVYVFTYLNVAEFELHCRSAFHKKDIHWPGNNVCNDYVCVLWYFISLTWTMVCVAGLDLIGRAGTRGSAMLRDGVGTSPDSRPRSTSTRLRAARPRTPTWPSAIYYNIMG